MEFSEYMHKYGVEVVKPVIENDGTQVLDSVLDLAAVLEGSAAPRNYQKLTPLHETA